MATYVKYNQFVEDLANKVHDLMGTAGSGADTCKVCLTNAAPNVATHVVRADITELSTANGYTSGGSSIANVGSRSSGTFTLAATDVVFTASGGSIGPFRYAVIYNDTPTSPADPLVAYYDYGSSITLADTETFTVDFTTSLFTLA
jgi:hypothetical protein